MLCTVAVLLISFHFTSPFSSLHFTSLHFTSLHFTAIYFILFYFNYFIIFLMIGTPLSLGLITTTLILFLQQLGLQERALKISAVPASPWLRGPKDDELRPNQRHNTRL
jgi:hypothetical protein